jgi:hypothetical protein
MYGRDQLLRVGYETGCFGLRDETTDATQSAGRAVINK